MGFSKHYDHLYELWEKGILSKKYYLIIKEFFLCYDKALKKDPEAREIAVPVLDTFLGYFIDQIKDPNTFDIYHQKIPDYYKFSLDFLRPLVVKDQSIIERLELVKKMQQQMANGENVIFLANHQSESDPQAISIMLEDHYPEFAKKIIYVAGERVITDPLAIPFSMGCDLLCIYSKRYINNPPEKKQKKQLHNKQAMELMSRLLAEGGKVVFVAPSGGRDRPDSQGEMQIAPFDPNSIEMFYLMSKKAKTPTHFYPLSLLTYALLPPPDTVQEEMGERRTTARTPIGIAFGDEIEMENIVTDKSLDRKQTRSMRAKKIYDLVEKNYQPLKKIGK